MCTMRNSYLDMSCFILLFVIRLRYGPADSEGIPLVMRDTVGFLQENGRSFSQVRFMAQSNFYVPLNVNVLYVST